jgi:ABC-type uncharacterized transport system substrate-binding protein
MPRFSRWPAGIFTAAGIIFPVLLGLPVSGLTHPHLFVDYELFFVFNDKGLTGIKERWTFDEMFSTMVREEYDRDRNKIFDSTEILEIERTAFSNLENFDYFTFIRIGREELTVKGVGEFTADIHEERVRYTFFVPCPVPATEHFKSLQVSIFDKSYYTALQMADDKLILQGAEPYYSVETKIKRAKEFICYEEDGFPETVVIRFKRRP